jgi:hypothetical protein
VIEVQRSRVIKKPTIIRGIEGKPRAVYGNVPNEGLIDNPPRGTVEVVLSTATA